MKSCYIYIRVSTEEQAKEGFSVDNQKRACLEYAKNNEYLVEDVFTDDGKSARTTERPAFQQLLGLVEKGHVEAVIIYKIDRFARNVGDFSSIRKHFKDLGVKLLSVTENDVTEGLIGNIFASVAEWESEVNGQRTRDALMQKFRDGWQPTPPPLGYRSVGGPKERKTAEPDPFTAPIIKELFELYSTGNYSILGAQRWLKDKNVVTKKNLPLSHGVIHGILKNPYYYGIISWRGQTKIGKHEPVVSKPLFDICQYVLAKHRNFLTRERKHSFLLRGFIFCAECGQRYTAEWHENRIKLAKRGGKIAYYHCQKREKNGCPAPYVETTELESQAEKEIQKMQFSQKFIDAVIRKTEAYLKNNRQTISSKRQGLVNQKSGLETKRGRLEDDLLDRTIDKEVFKRKHSEIENSIFNLNEQIQELESKSKLDFDLVAEVLDFTTDIHKTYLEAPDFLKRHYLRFFFEKLIVKNKAINEVVPTPIFATLRANRQVIIRNLVLRGKDSNLQPHS